MPHLIVNADDFGAGQMTDRGILRAFSSGIVTSASLLANGAHAVEAMRMAKDSGLPTGVHLNLAEGTPLTGPIPGLTGSNGRFPGKTALRQILSDVTDVAAIGRELCAQIESLLAAGLRPDHLDSHQHFFLFPAMTELVLDLADRYQIKALRLPMPVEDPADDPVGELGQELDLYRSLAPAAGRVLASRPLRCPRGLFGMPRLNRLDESSLLQIIGQIPPGSWELMVHPGYADRENPFGGHPREIELQALLSPRVRMRIAQCGIRLIHFGELS